mmetsp:Transcript_34307/g.55383  ORF Transcript_34307/g.55383 Transcript_34307/m.55383 type:complete len:290 (-) Transcript_34307:318-1187(-)
MRVPGSSCFALAFISLLQSGFPIYFSYSWASVYDDEMLNDTDNWTKYEIAACYIVVLWALTLNNILCPLSGIGAPCAAPSHSDAAGNTLSWPCTLAHVLRNFALFINVVAGLFLTIVGFWIIVYTWPWTSCADIGLNPVADENTDPLDKNHACTSIYIIAWMQLILLAIVCLVLMCQLCIVRAANASSHRFLDCEGWRAITPEWAINWQRALLLPRDWQGLSLTLSLPQAKTQMPLANMGKTNPLMAPGPAGIQVLDTTQPVYVPPSQMPMHMPTQMPYPQDSLHMNTA